MNKLSRLIGIVFSPGRIFKGLDENPDLLFGVFIPIFSWVLLGVSAILIGLRDPSLEIKLANLGVDQDPNLIKYWGPILLVSMGLVMSFLLFLIKAGLIHVLVPFMNGKTTYRKIVSVLGYSHVPFAIWSVFVLFYLLLNTHHYVAVDSSIALFFLPQKIHPALYALYSRLDVFLFWAMFLAILGISTVCRLGRIKATALILTLWIMGTLLTVGFNGYVKPLFKGENESSAVNEQEGNQ